MKIKIMTEATKVFMTFSAGVLQTKKHMCKALMADIIIHPFKQRYITGTFNTEGWRCRRAGVSAE